MSSAWCLALLLSLPSAERPARVESAPARAWPVAVALVADSRSLDDAGRAAIRRWREVSEERGLSTWYCEAEWSSTAEVRDVLARLRVATPPIEGAFLVGDVPTYALHEATWLVAGRERRAHATSRGAPGDGSSAPRDELVLTTDLPYADLHLLLEPVGAAPSVDATRAGTRPPADAWRLRIDSPLSVEKDLYVGRFSPPEDVTDASRRRALVSEYLARATRFHESPRTAARVRVLADETCEYAWLAARTETWRAAFPSAPDGSRSFVVEALRAPRRASSRFQELACDPSFDVLVIARPPGSSRANVSTNSWPAARHALGPVVFVAPDGFLGEPLDSASVAAARALARPGAALAAMLGGERGAELGLLAVGEPIGRLDLDEVEPTATIVGDPTLRFAAMGNGRVRVDPLRDPETSLETLSAMSSVESPVFLRVGALRALARRQGAAAAPDLARLVASDPAPAVRLVALACLARLRAPELGVALPGTLADESALVRRAGAALMGELGRAEDLEHLARHLGRDASVDVDRTVVSALARYPEDMIAALDPRAWGAGARTSVGPVPTEHDASWEYEGLGRAGLALEIERIRGLVRALEAPDTNAAERLRVVRECAFSRPHRAIGLVLALAQDERSPELLRRACVQTLAAYVHSPARTPLVVALERLASDADTSAELRTDARRTMRRLSDGANVPFDP